PDEDRHTAALCRKLDHLFVVSQKHCGLAAPFELQRLQRGPELTAIGAVAVVQVIDKRDNAAVLHADSNLQRGEEGFPHRLIAHSLDQLTANPPLNIPKLRDHFLHRPTPRGLPVKWRHTAKLAVEMTPSRCETTLSRHIGVGTQQFDTGTLIVLQRRK